MRDPYKDPPLPLSWWYGRGIAGSKEVLAKYPEAPMRFHVGPPLNTGMVGRKPSPNDPSRNGEGPRALVAGIVAFQYGVDLSPRNQS